MSTMYPFPSHVSVQSFVTVKLCDKGMYDLWKIQMLYLLKSHHMLGLIKNRGSVDDDWKRSDALVSGWILASLSEQAAIMVLSRLKSKFPQQTDFTAKETWDEVQIMYGQHEAEQCGGAAVFHQEKRMEEVDGRSKNNQQMYLAAEYGRLDTLRIILKKTKVEITDAITINGNTALHVAVANNTFLESMLELLPYNKALMGVRNSDGSTLLHVAAAYGNINAAKILVCRSPELLSAKDNEGCTPLDIVLSNPWHTETCLFLWNSALPDIEQLDSRFEHLVKAISHGYFDLAKSYIQSYSSLKSAAVLMAIAQYCPADFSPHQIYLYEMWSTPIWHFVNRDSLAIDMDHGFLKLANLVLRAVVVSPFKMLLRICMKLSVFKNYKEKMERRSVARALLDIVCEKIKFSNDTSSYPAFYTEPILEAIRRDASDVVEKIVNWFPSAAMVVDEDGNNISQASFKNRASRVAALVINTSIAKHTSLSQKIKDDHCGNNFLHYVARLGPSKKLNLLSSPPFQLQLELRWFKLAQEKVPQGLMEKNCFGETPEMVFTKEHKELLVECGNWMKSTANSHALTATIIITIMFAAAITVPGGNDEKNKGVPNFNGKPAFIVFEVSIVIAMVTAYLSMLLFSTILNARFTEQDFHIRRPLALMVASVSLLLSAMFSMVAFGAALSLIFGMEIPWALGFIAALIGIPMAISSNFYSNLLHDWIHNESEFSRITFSGRLNLLGRILI
ncbi:putative ankyrin repeat-containing domain, PGG domain, ankyrin repeat-containing domain superfamily [Helianthus annuus]|nr:putative ankyrin repeat-containing domain, PGG domain, ankyrin repeat-containing domain superfamily [Helianthus annuus]KAJ0532282.1 putative ankyrin repeat-containing domain, PGG domain, ankyrin repeat-containing domain superfamily [Helianthus annuus]KAJ0710047.1 putative ankyrin repeat-containing domain, PGG domain, ankyrin repeat-containing domain superfamily [Helianthus annuus]